MDRWGSGSRALKNAVLCICCPGKDSEAFHKLRSQEMNGKQLEWAGLGRAGRARAQKQATGNSQWADQKSAEPVRLEERVRGRGKVSGCHRVSLCRLGQSGGREAPKALFCSYFFKSVV